MLGFSIWSIFHMKTNCNIYTIISSWYLVELFNVFIADLFVMKLNFLLKNFQDRAHKNTSDKLNLSDYI